MISLKYQRDKISQINLVENIVRVKLKEICKIIIIKLNNLPNKQNCIYFLK